MAAHTSTRTLLRASLLIWLIVVIGILAVFQPAAAGDIRMVVIAALAAAPASIALARAFLWVIESIADDLHRRP